MNDGLISRTILQQAGQIIQRECYLNYPDGIQIQNFSCGIAVTSAGNLKNVKNIFHLTMPPFSKIDWLDKHVKNKIFLKVFSFYNRKNYS